MIAYDGRETADKALQQVIDGGLLHGLALSFGEYQ